MLVKKKYTQPSKKIYKLKTDSDLEIWRLSMVFFVSKGKFFVSM